MGETEGPKADSWGDGLGEGAANPSHQLGGLNERCELHSGVRGGARPRKGFPLFSALRMASPDYHSAVVGKTLVRTRLGLK